MGRINMGRVIVGGLLAGLVINISEFVLNTFVIEKDMTAAMQALNLPPIDTAMVGCFVVLGFLLGISTVWLYAAIRPRFGAGVRTAAVAGSMVWLLAYLYPSAFMGAMQLFPRNLLIIGIVWGLPEALIATVVGAKFYTEA